ncbi:SurA N-terminal domain-containing protein [Ectothiorhodospira lacustris]|uniref:SurA N-terminal domain-containing protein n=1 Tax=Ectothiorhodospira lacustris TaxID=2899127 RepID=UPI001EE7BC51|nr:SurA N-terminal domain-containing protein [Ectothiorhodospira lacustris]MCG5499590.1 SurA N-terminal domain-containing protein [Ectothiorhodospira lacustris]MCG5508716.1 SurA N-terminal domain-containing protein [Ectothiorhodospira lacustris]MCG5520507.1 SurA N-terminal domain-containing protein [Ectothiorhodospira lacustris]
MLLKIRDKASGWLAYAIIIMIAIPFALWGVHEYFGGGARLVAVEVNGVEITTRALQREVQQQRQQVAQFFGGRLPPELVDDERLRENALQTLIRRELMQQAVAAQGFRVSQQAVARELAGFEAFQRDGVFDPVRYTQLLEAQRISRGAFEQDVAMGLLMEQFEGGVRISAFVTDAEVREYLRLRDQERDLSYFVIPAAEYAAGVEISDEDVQAYYAAHGDRFRTPERVRLEYLLLDLEQLEARITPSESELRRHYQQQIDRFTTPEERRAAHILVRVGADADADAVADARARAQALRARVSGGEDFARVAADASEDRLTAARGGDLGYVQRGDLGPALDGVLFTQSVGDLSQPVRTSEGFHLILLSDIERAYSEPFENVREQVAEELRARQVESRQIELMERLLTESYEHPRSLDAAADATGLEIRRSDWMTRDQGQELGSFPMVRQAAFSQEVLQEGRNSDLIDLPDGRSVVVRVSAHEPAAPRALAEVANEIRALIRREQSGRLSREAGERVLEALRDGGDLTTVVEGLPGSLEQHRTITRDSTDVPGGIITAAFGLSASGAAGMSLDSGDYALVKLHAVRDVEPGRAELARARSHLEGLYGALDFEAVLNAMEAEAKIKIHRDNL